MSAVFGDDDQAPPAAGDGDDHGAHAEADAAASTDATDAAAPTTAPTPAPQRKSPGHGRNGATAYRGAKRLKVPHPTLKRGDPCPACPKGKVYPLAEPALLLRITGMAPLGADLFELERLRCNACNQVFTAPAPPGVGTAKYDETAPAMVGLLKYGTGVPWNRLEQVQRWLGIPLPASTQWELVRDVEPVLAPVFAECIRQAAQGQLVHNDDTPMKVLELMEDAKPFTPEAHARAAADDGRTGVYTSGIVARVDDHRLALFFTGPRHAGENLEAVLKQRAAALPPPIQMSDALSHNTAGDFETIVASCLAHARRQFVDVVNDFPDECRHVLDALRQVYRDQGKGYHLLFERAPQYFAEAFRQATTNARKIFFNLDGFSFQRAWATLGKPMSPFNLTNWEFWQVLANSKTVFMKGGKERSVDYVLRKLLR
jgi:hypothetical protein